MVINFLSIQVTVAYIVIIVVMLLFCLVMFKQNRVLKDEIRRLREEVDSLLHKGNVSKSNDDTVSINEISCDEVIDDDVREVLEDKILVKEEKTVKRDNVYKANVDNHGDLLDGSVTIMEDNVKNNKKESKKDNKRRYYTKNVLHNKKCVTSPVSIDNKVVSDDFNINDFVKKKNRGSSKKDNFKGKKDSFSYLQEVSQELANASSNTIELTDYEKREEDNAIISYQELLRVKDQIKVIDDDNGDVDFLEELKSFRNSLN